MTTLAALRRACEDRLRAARVPTPELDARFLIEEALALPPGAWLLAAERTLGEDRIAVVQSLIDRRIAREPVWRILGHRAFWTIDLALSPATLEPRPDSETVIEAALSFVPDRQSAVRILDLGTGTGCLLLALLAELPNATGLGIDRAEAAIATASANAATNGLADRATFSVGNWGQGVTATFDLVLSNPPYIPTSDISGLAPEVRDHDPLAALDGGADGLDAYRQIAPQLPHLLRPGGQAIFEVGQGQAAAVSALLEDAGLRPSGLFLDLASIERCVCAQMKNE